VPGGKRTGNLDEASVHYSCSILPRLTTANRADVMYLTDLESNSH